MPSAAGVRADRDFFATDARALAQRLLGCRLVRVDEAGERLAGVIAETEAYLGVRDRAAHCFGGRRTPRNESMYGPPGLAYVYFTYGMHHCMNVVCGDPGEPTAVLLRALEPASGHASMRANRRSIRRRSPIRDTDLCSGPGRLCQALRIDRDLDGEDLCASDRLFIEPSPGGPGRPVRVSARVGVDSAGVWARRRLRWFFADSPHVSRR
ncbi:MAG: DNA-3-methyladenine glycosylase [Planctomycetota bacterium]|nr:MAG: DNA-3-methyladenine glycosylase [Planctomycetota bacterium]